MIGERSHVYRLLIGKPEGKRQFGKPRYKWVEDIKVDLGDILRVVLKLVSL
jgi:hypothetical protein